MLGIKGIDNKYCNSDKTVRDISTVNQHIADARMDALGDTDEVHNTSENVEIHALKEFTGAPARYYENTGTYGLEHYET